jgi:dihydroorotate dehydrogenase (NAD+) catalytic subunit
LKPIALAAVYSCYRATGLPIVGMGGIATGRDALEFVAAGARSVALGTVLFADPAAPHRVRSDLEGEALRLGVASLDDAVGAAHRGESALNTLDSHLRVGV